MGGRENEPGRCMASDTTMSARTGVARISIRAMGIWAATFAFLVAAASAHAEPAVDEEFSDLADWEPLEFDDIDRETDYYAEEEDGDTYPIRVYVNFEYDADEVGFGTRLQYSTIRAIYGEYPPLGSLVYIWSNRRWDTEWYESPFTSRAMMLPIDQGRQGLMEWREHRRNIVEDYREAFGEDPSETAQLAIMGDSYGSGETSRAWLDYVWVLGD